MHQKTTLPTGLRILTSSMPHTRSVSIGLFAAVGSRYEESTEAGISHFIEHMLFKGTDRRPRPQDIAQAIEGIGGIFNASTGREITTYWAKVAQPHYPLALDVLVDMLLHSRLEEREVEKERLVISEEIKGSLDTPEELVQILATRLLWPDHPLGQDIAGTTDTVSAMTRPRLLDYMGATYRPSTLAVAAAGNLDHEEFVDRVASYLESWRTESMRGFRPAPDSQERPRLEVAYRRTQQAQIAVLVPGLHRLHPDRFALRVLNALLGEGMSSRLFQEIRERQGLAYSVHSHVSFMHDAGAVGVSAGVDPGKTEAAIRAVGREWQRLKGEPVDEEELRKAKEYAKGRLMLQMEDTYAVASWMGSQEVLTDQVLSVDEVVQAIEEVTSEDVRRVAQEVLLPQKLNLALVGPFRGQRRFSALLENAG